MQAIGQNGVERTIAREVHDALADTRVVALNGARQVGKSTLATAILRRYPEARSVTLDDDAVRSAALEDPAYFVRSNGLLHIDEIQRAPQLLLAIKANVDRDQRPGRFLLTGSAYVLTIPRLADSLAGRMQIIRLYPFTQGELLGKEEHFVDTLLAGNNDMLTTGELDKEAYVELSTRGGYPEAVARTSDRRRGRWFDSYIETYVAKDIADLAAIERLDVLPRLLQLVAARTASVLNVEDLARDIRMSPKSVASYLALLETTFFIHRLSAWSPNRTTRITHKPKVFVSDPGLAAHLRSESIRSLLRPGGDPGPLLETFVVMELVRQLSWSNERATIHHFRTRDGVEVDAVLEAADGRVAGVEVKASSSVKPHDLRGLRYLAEQAGDRFVGGVLLYSGRETLSFGNRIWATPMSSLWQSL